MEEPQKVIVVESRRSGVVAGLIATILAIIGFFTYGLVFVPPAIIVALIGTVVALKNVNLGGIAANILAWVFITVAFVASPSLWVALALLFGSPTPGEQSNSNVNLPDSELLTQWARNFKYIENVPPLNDRDDPLYAELAANDFVDLSQSSRGREIGAQIFGEYCTPCHGDGGRGTPGYPDLTDDDWQWGGSEEDLIKTIAQGRVGFMPALASAIGGDTGVDNMVKYVRYLSGGEMDAGAATAEPLFLSICSACHGADGTGNKMLGAPNLTDDVWLYGSSAEAIRETIVNGREGRMPSHDYHLGENATRIVAAYVFGLSR